MNTKTIANVQEIPSGAIKIEVLGDEGKVIGTWTVRKPELEKVKSGSGGKVDLDSISQFAAFIQTYREYVKGEFLPKK